MADSTYSDGVGLTGVGIARNDPRARMAAQLPVFVQPFLTWLTARPAPGETARPRAATSCLWMTGGWLTAGLALGAFAFSVGGPAAWCVMPLALLVISSALGLAQITMFHRCAHHAVFAGKQLNRDVGRLLSAVLLFKQFDAYRREHLLHHNARNLLTEEDEFADFVLGMCRLTPETPKAELWRRVLLDVVLSPAFHLLFLRRRVQASWGSPDRLHNRVGVGIWATAALVCILTGCIVPFLVLWVLPVTLLLQIATVGRILIEHRFPEPALIAIRSSEFVCLATAGVFPGSAPPEANLGSWKALRAWTAWWMDIVTVQLVVRLFFLVGDVPCHDFHHRRPNGDLVGYIHVRQKDVDAGCPGFPLNYGETWGFFRAIDENLAMLARTPRIAIQGFHALR